MNDVQHPGEPHIGVVIAFAFVVRAVRAEARGARLVLSSDLVAGRPSRANFDGRLRI